MKIKTDFVTNSSSSCYIVFVPPGSKMTFEEYMIDENYYEDDVTQEEIQQEFENAQKAIEKLIDGKEVFNPEYDSDNFRFWSLINWLQEKGFLITAADTGGGDGMDTIVGLDMEKIKKIIIEYSDVFAESARIMKS